MNLTWAREKKGSRRATLKINDGELEVHISALDDRRCVLTCTVYHWHLYQKQSTLPIEVLQKIAEEVLVPTVIAYVGDRGSKGLTGFFATEFKLENDPVEFIYP